MNKETDASIRQRLKDGLIFLPEQLALSVALAQTQNGSYIKAIYLVSLKKWKVEYIGYDYAMSKENGLFYFVGSRQRVSF